jgi:hypothetical protein
MKKTLLAMIAAALLSTLICPVREYPNRYYWRPIFYTLPSGYGVDGLWNATVKNFDQWRDRIGIPWLMQTVVVVALAGITVSLLRKS